jgi:SAM-dependent methyltransferase
MTYIENTHVNLTAYEGVENMGRFTEDSFQKYCSDKLFSCSKHVSFLKKHFPKSQFKILEVGSGSGKLLFRLEKEGMLLRGVGFEPSSTRTAFADSFAKYIKSSLVEIYQEDYVKSSLSGDRFDVIIGIDVVINLIGAISINYINDFFKKSIEYLEPDGLIILESITLQREIEAIRKSENGVFTPWKRFAESDPFKYGLDEMSLDELGNLVWKKFFIERTTGREESFTNILQPLNKSSMKALAVENGLKVSFFDNWDEMDDTSDEEFVAVFTK